MLRLRSWSRCRTASPRPCTRQRRRAVADRERAVPADRVARHRGLITRADPRSRLKAKSLTPSTWTVMNPSARIKGRKRAGPDARERDGTCHSKRMNDGIKRAGPPQAVQKLRENFYVVQVQLSEIPS